MHNIPLFIEISWLPSETERAFGGRRLMGSFGVFFSIFSGVTLLGWGNPQLPRGWFGVLEGSRVGVVMGGRLGAGGEGEE